VAATGILYLDDRYVFSLRAFLALRYTELYFLAFIQRFVATSIIDLLKMHEYIGAWCLLDKAKPLSELNHLTMPVVIVDIISPVNIWL